MLVPSRGRSWLAPVLAMPVTPLAVGPLESVASSVADGVAAAFVLVVRCDVPDRFVEPDRVVFEADAFELAGEHGGVGDGHEMRVFALDVTPQRLDPRLVGRRGRPAEVLGDGAHSQEPAGVATVHLRAVVGD